MRCKTRGITPRPRVNSYENGVSGPVCGRLLLPERKDGTSVGDGLRGKLEGDPDAARFSK